MIILLSLLAAEPVATVKLVDLHVTDARPAEEPRRSPYRIDPNVAGPADGKRAAVGVTGATCAVTGPTLCTRKPRTLFSSSY